MWRGCMKKKQVYEAREIFKIYEKNMEHISANRLTKNMSPRTGGASEYLFQHMTSISHAIAVSIRSVSTDDAMKQNWKKNLVRKTHVFEVSICFLRSIVFGQAACPHVMGTSHHLARGGLLSLGVGLCSWSLLWGLVRVRGSWLGWFLLLGCRRNIYQRLFSPRSTSSFTLLNKNKNQKTCSPGIKKHSNLTGNGVCLIPCNRQIGSTFCFRVLGCRDLSNLWLIVFCIIH